jgi:hypothetical protein
LPSPVTAFSSLLMHASLLWGENVPSTSLTALVLVIFQRKMGYEGKKPYSRSVLIDIPIAGDRSSASSAHLSQSMSMVAGISAKIPRMTVIRKKRESPLIAILEHAKS